MLFIALVYFFSIVVIIVGLSLVCASLQKAFRPKPTQWQLLKDRIDALITSANPTKGEAIVVIKDLVKYLPAEIPATSIVYTMRLTAGNSDPLEGETVIELLRTLDRLEAIEPVTWFDYGDPREISSFRINTR